MEPNFNELNNTDHEDAPHLFETLSPEYTDIPDPEHFDTICEGALDTVKGMESMSTTYTKAQSYLFACMSAADHIDYKQQRAGMEGGFFSAIGDGLGAAWDFIKKMFTAVWRAFFGGGDDTVESKVEKAEKKVKKDKEDVQEDVKPGKSDEVVEKQRKKAKDKANKVKKDPKASSSDKAIADQMIKKIDEGNVKSTKQKEDDLKVIKESYFKISKDTRETIIKNVGEAESLRRKYKEYVEKDRSSEVTSDRWKKCYATFKSSVFGKLLDHPINQIVKVDAIKNLGQGVDVFSQLEQVLSGHRGVAETISSQKATVESEIKELEEAIRKKGKGSNSGEVHGEKYNTKDQVRERLASAKVVLGIINATAGYQTKAVQSVERLSANVKEHFCPFM
ncbi:hypothetical protein D3C79_48500 [compost metagenome]